MEIFIFGYTKLKIAHAHTEIAHHPLMIPSITTNFYMKFPLFFSV